jgi:hypothetical protein
MHLESSEARGPGAKFELESSAQIMAAEANSLRSAAAPAGAPKMELSLAFGIPQHDSIIDSALSSFGFRQPGLAQIKGGSRAQDISPSTRNLSSHHFDSNSFMRAYDYTKKAESVLNRKLSGPYQEADAPGILEDFGKRLHTLQDFYAHSNYVETQLKANPRLFPQEIPLMDWGSIPAGKAGYRSGYAIKDETLQPSLKRSDVINKLNETGERLPGTQYLPGAAYDRLTSFADRLDYATDPRYSILHRDTAKDDGKCDEGKVVNPFTKYRLYDYARDLAVRETARQWREFESTVRKLHGDSEGEMILTNMKKIQIYPPEPKN